MKIKNIIVMIMLAIIMVVVLPLNGYAKVFKDISDDFWAKDTIEEMSKQNIIVGYSDGTFRPNKEVKKAEVLVVLARILGVNSKENEDLVESAKQEYTDILEEYDTYATREIAYLLEKEILKEKELDLYVGNANKSMLRLEAVPLIVRIIEKEDELSDKNLVVLNYKDAEFIPQKFRAYVEYLGKEGLMGTATNDNRFLPNDAITRAQIATLASRIINKMEQTIPKEQEDSDNFSNSEIEGKIKNVYIDSEKSKRLITIVKNNKEREIPISSDVEVIVNDEKSQVVSIQKDDYAIISINDKGEATKIVTEEKDKTIKGTVCNVDTEDKLISVDVDSKVMDIIIKEDTIIIRNGQETNIENIKKGDKATLFFHYNVLKSISVISVKKEEQGTIKEILISKNPKLTIKDTEGNESTYDISENTKVNVYDKKGNIYDLRLDYKVKVSLDSSEVVKVRAFEQIKGSIDTIVKEYGEIVLLPNDDSLEDTIQLLVNSNTDYVKEGTKEKLKISDLKPEQEIIAIGKLNKSTFYVNEIIVVE